MEVKLNENINQLGLFATIFYPCGSVVFVLEGDLSDTPIRESIRIGTNLHIVDKYGSYMNHSFEPTCKIDSCNVVAVKDIYPGDELNFNYNDSEVNMACPFEVNGVIVSGSLSN